MTDERENYLKNLALKHLMESPLGEKIEKAMYIFEKVQNHLYALSEKDGSETTIKIATITTFALLKKMSQGIRPSAFSPEDWKEIANAVSEYAILQDDQNYVKLIFRIYANYIRYSAEQIELFVSEEVVSAIRMLADELDEKTECLDKGKIGEVEYIETCLWVSLEAMIKLLSAFSSKFLKDEYAEFVQALAMYAFEYGRFVLYNREQELINEFIEQQRVMDERLEQKYDLFIKDLEEKTKQFYMLIENAFSPDFRQNFLQSIILAQAAGVDDNEVLMSIEDIDTYFMD